MSRVGAGAAGASTAYHLQNFSKNTGAEIEITVFERSSYIGGRSTTVNIYDDPSQPVELGASIFVEVNTILKAATEAFNLSARDGSAETDDPETLGIWNGEKFVFTQRDGGWAWWDITKLIWKYGLAPIRTQRLMKSTTSKFFKLYTAPFFPFRSLSERVTFLDLVSVTAVTGEEYLKANKVKTQRSKFSSRLTTTRLALHFRQISSKPAHGSTTDKILGSFTALRQWCAWPLKVPCRSKAVTGKYSTGCSTLQGLQFISTQS